MSPQRIRPRVRSRGISRPTRGPAFYPFILVGVVIGAPAGAQQDAFISPFAAYSQTGSAVAGVGLSLSAGLLGVRASGYVPLGSMSLGGAPSSASAAAGGDMDGVLAVGGASGSLISPYVFAGASRLNEGGEAVTGWSYGAGIALHVLGPVDAFAESRQRMSRFVLPTAYGAPAPSSELRAGLSLHLGTWRRTHFDSRVTVIPAGAPRGGSIGTIEASGTAARVLPTAEQYIGVPYRYGGTSPTTGFDCSGFTQFVFAKHGVRLPRTAHEQAQVGLRLPADWRALSPGDLVMFDEGGRIGHVAIYAGNGRIIHSSSSGHGVRYDDLSTQRGHWFRDHMVAARRVTPDSRGLLLDLARGFTDTAGMLLDAADHAPKP